MSESTFQLAEDSPQSLRDYVKRLETEAAEAKAAKETAGKAERKLAFMQAGVNPEDEKAKYFVNGYDGELTPDAIKEEAVKLGLIEANPAPPEQSQAERIAGAEGAGGDGNLPDYRQSKEAFQAEMKKVHAEGGRPALLELLEKNGIGNSLVQ